VQGSSPVLKGMDIMQLMAAAAPGASQDEQRRPGGETVTGAGKGRGSMKTGKGSHASARSAAASSGDILQQRLRLPTDLAHGIGHYKDEPDDEPDADRLKNLYSKVTLAIATTTTCVLLATAVITTIITTIASTVISTAVLPNDQRKHSPFHTAAAVRGRVRP
jgi:hypothetical protein